MSVLEQIKKLEDQKRALDDQKAQLLKQAKQEALGKVNDAVKELNALGFAYSVVEGEKASTGTRRTGIRQEVLTVISKGNGLTRAGIDSAMSADDKSTKQSISNALSALKKSNKISQNDQGLYTAVS
jgi:hypothetical protein